MKNLEQKKTKVVQDIAGGGSGTVVIDKWEIGLPDIRKCFALNPKFLK